MELFSETVRPAGAKPKPLRFGGGGFRLKRFDARGLNGLEEDMRSGRPPTYSAAETGMIIGAVLTCPAELGLPFACWTLDRMVAHVSEQGIGMRRSRLGEILCDEGLQ
jgi:hypothetical protein